MYIVVQPESGCGARLGVNFGQEGEMKRVVVYVAASLLATSPVAAQEADLILVNGTIYTVDESQPKAEALAVAGDRILAVGSRSEIDKLRGPGTQVIDLQGKTVLPGLIDSHYHFMGVGRLSFTLNLDGTKSLEDLLARLEDAVKKRKPGEWITGRGWIEEDWPSKAFPTRWDLDKVAPRNPVYLTRADGHAGVANSEAIRIAGVTAETVDPPGGKIVKDPDTGEPTGMFVDRAQGLIRKYIKDAEIPAEEVAKAAARTTLSWGLTTIHSAGEGWDTIDVYRSLFEEGELPVRIYSMVYGPGEGAERLLDNGAEVGLYDNRLTVRSIKVVADGALGSRGAALLEPYSDEPNSTGLLMYDEAKLMPMLKQALEKGIQVNTHAIGDKANRFILDVYEKAFAAVLPPKRKVGEPRWRIEHAQIIHPDDIPRFAKLGVIPSMQPSHAIGDLHFAPRRLGLNRLKGAYAWRSLLDTGIHIAGGSDAPVESPNPFIDLYAAVVRKDTTGFATDGWHLEERVSRLEALKMFTIWAAEAAFEEEIKGSLTPGKLADLVVISDDFMTMPEEELFRIQVLMTMVGGQIVYTKEGSGFPKASD
jgi:predicted amidohydrolase YtcJ